MPILKGSKYPSDVARRQQQLLGMKGYHLIFDEPCTAKDWEKPLPCPVTDGVCVDVFLYQNDDQNERFRFCLNRYSKTPYVEIGHFNETRGNYLNTTVNGKRGPVNSLNIIPRKGQYYWITFYLKAPDKFRGYFCNTSVGEQSVNYSKLDTFYVHGSRINETNILSLHITKAWTTNAPSPLQGNIPTTYLNFTFATSTIHAYGVYHGGNNKKLKFSVYEEGSPPSNALTFEVDVGPNNPNVILFHIMSFGIRAIAGDGILTASTTAMAGDLTVMVTIVNNFTVESVHIHTGMNNW